MSQTSNSDPGIPGLTTGISHPLQVNRFRALFKDPEGKLLYGSQALTHQLIRTSEYGVYRGVTLTFEEDVTGHAGRALQELAKLTNFTLCLEYLDGNETAVKTATFTGCKVNTMLYSALDYAGGHSSVGEELRLSVPSWEGKKFDKLAEEHPAAATLIALLKGSHLQVMRDREAKRGVAEVAVTLNYGDLAVVWADLG